MGTTSDHASLSWMGGNWAEINTTNNGSVGWEDQSEIPKWTNQSINQSINTHVIQSSHALKMYGINAVFTQRRSQISVYIHWLWSVNPAHGMEASDCQCHSSQVFPPCPLENMAVLRQQAYRYDNDNVLITARWRQDDVVIASLSLDFEHKWQDMFVISNSVESWIIHLYSWCGSCTCGFIPNYELGLTSK